MRIYTTTIALIFILISIVSCKDSSPNAKSSPSKSAPSPLSISAAKRKQIERFFAHISHDASYIVASITPIPKSAQQFHLDNTKKIMQLVARSYNLHETTLYTLADDSDKPLSAITQSTTAQAKKTNSSEFFADLFAHISHNLTLDKLQNIGLKTDAIAVLYNFDTQPIFRYQLDNPDNLLNTLKTIAQSNQHTLNWKKCHRFSCLLSEPDKQGDRMALVLFEEQLVIASFNQRQQNQVIDHMVAKSLPQKSFSLERWISFLEKNNFKGYADGFANAGDISSYITRALAKQESDAITSNSINDCGSLLNSHLTFVKRIVFGLPNIDKHNVTTEIVLEFDKQLTQLLQSLNHDNESIQHTANGMIEIGINMNPKRFHSVANSYANFLTGLLQETECSLLSPQTVNQFQTILFGIKITLGKESINNVFFVADNIEFIPNTKKTKKLDGYISIGSQDPQALFKKILRLQPKLQNITIKQNDKPVAIPTTQLNNVPLDNLAVAADKDNIKLFLGDFKPTFSRINTNQNMLLWLRINNQRYAAHLAELNKTNASLTPNNTYTVTLDDTVEQRLIKQTRQNNNTQLQSISIDNRGLILRHQVEYH